MEQNQSYPWISQRELRGTRNRVIESCTVGPYTATVTRRSSQFWIAEISGPGAIRLTSALPSRVEAIRWAECQVAALLKHNHGSV